MTEKESKELIEFMDKRSKEILATPGGSRKFLIDAGIETEESMREHEEKMKKKRRKKK